MYLIFYNVFNILNFLSSKWLPELYLSFAHFADNESQRVELLKGVLVSPLHLLEFQLERVVQVHQPLVGRPHHPVLAEPLNCSLQSFLSLAQKPA